MQERLNINIGTIGRTDTAEVITNAVRGLVVARAAETEDLQLVARAVAACARREANRTALVFGADSVRTVLTASKADLLDAQEAVLSQATETPQAVLRLLQ